MIKRSLAFFLVLLISGCLSACSVSTSNIRKSGSTANSVNFDINQYDSHGILSDGLVWVERTISSYDSSPKTKFAYLDIDGNVISKWFNSSEWNKADFLNGLLVLRGKYYMPPNSVTASPPKLVCTEIYNKKFELVSSIYVATETGYEAGQKTTELLITDANENGEVFAIGEQSGSSRSLFKITNDETVRFETTGNQLFFASIKNLKRIYTDNGYYVVDFRESMMNMPTGILIIDKQGELIMDMEKQIDYTVFSVDIISDDQIKIKFMGKDDRYYNVNINFDGEFLSTPTLAN